MSAPPANDSRLILCLELAAFVVEPFAPLREHLARQGVSFRSLSDEQANHPETWLARFAPMDNAARNADPFAPRTTEQIAARVREYEHAPSGCVVADDGTRLIGYTYFHRATGDDAGRARQGWTGVRPECRRNGVATILKVEGILLARSLGYEHIVTDPRADNTASVRMSMRVGFRVCEGDAG